jgi:hypothetical protein
MVDDITRRVFSWAHQGQSRFGRQSVFEAEAGGVASASGWQE